MLVRDPPRTNSTTRKKSPKFQHPNFNHLSVAAFKAFLEDHKFIITLFIVIRLCTTSGSMLNIQNIQLGIGPQR